MASRAFDRIRSFGGGQDSFRPASEIEVNQSQKMQNMIVRNNYACRTRPGADQIGAVSFVANIAPSGPVQALFYFSTPAHPNIILMGQGAKLYTWDGSTWSAPLAFALANANAQPAIAQGVDKVLISDGVSHCQVWDGAAFTDCGDPNGQLNPPLLDKLCWIAGRMVGAGEDNPDTIYLSNLLAFGPGQWNKATQSFRVGSGDGDNIVALAKLQNFNLAVLKENSVWLVNMNPAVPILQFLAQEQGDNVSEGIGCVGKNAWLIYKNDLLFMSEDGVQSLQRMQAAAAQYQISTPLSQPIQDLIDRINWSVGFLIKAIKYRQLAIFFVPLDNSAYNNYALVWNGILGQWTGYWTGWNTACACATRFNRTLQLVLGNHDGSVNLWKDAPSTLNDDTTYKDNGLPISWELDTRSLIFGNFDAQKKARMVLMRFNGGNAEVNLAANLDLADDDTWTEEVRPEGDTLPFVLPFKLASVKPIEVYRSLTGLPYFNEMYFKIASASGWAELRSVSSSAYIKPVVDPQA